MWRTEWKVKLHPSIGTEFGKKELNTLTEYPTLPNVPFKKEILSGTNGTLKTLALISGTLTLVRIIMIKMIVVIDVGNILSKKNCSNTTGHYIIFYDLGLHKLDGIYGSIVIRQAPSKDPNSHLYDYDLTTHIILVSDWMHEDAMERFPGRLAVNQGQDPDTLLLNGKGQFRVSLSFCFAIINTRDQFFIN